jgi:hypothetical protein
MSDYINGFIHPADITVFVFDAQTWYLAFAAASYQISIVGGVKHNILKGYFQIKPPKGQADEQAIGASTEIVQLVSLKLTFIFQLSLAPVV